MQTPGDERPIPKVLCFCTTASLPDERLAPPPPRMNMGICPVCRLHSAPEAEIRVLILVFNHVLSFDTDQTKIATLTHKLIETTSQR